MILKNDIKRRLKSPSSILILMVIPMVMTGIMGAVFAPSENNMMQVKVLIADNDKEPGAAVVLEAFKFPQVKDLFKVTVVDEREGRDLISSNKASALIIIPKGFSKNLLNKIETNLSVLKNPSEQFLPNIVEEFTRTLSIVLSGGVQVFNINTELIDHMKTIKKDKKSIADLIPLLLKDKNNSENFKTLMNYLNPPILKIKQKIIGKEDKGSGFNIFSYILPGISIMFLLFIIEIFIREILSERENGKLQRMMFAPLRVSEYISARIISGWLMGLFSYLIFVVMGILVFSINWGNYGYLFILIAITSFWVASFFALLNAFFKNKNQAGAFVAPIIMVFSAFGGSIIPSNQLPMAFRWISKLTLNHWFIVGTEQVRNNIFPSIPILILSSSGILLFLLAAKSLKKRILI